MGPDVKFYVTAAGAALLLLYFVKKNALEVGAGAGAAVVELGAGVAIGIGDAMGIPRTNMTQCEADRAAGRTWDATFSCSAPTWFKYLWTGK